MKREGGITLVALVITIIVMVILAGVTLYTLFSEEGIITKARQSVKSNEWGIVKEQLMLQLTDYTLNKKTEEDNKEYIEYFYEDGYLDMQSVVNMEKIANNTLKLGRGNLEDGDCYYLSDERLYYIEKGGERIDLGPFAGIGTLPSYLLWQVGPEDGEIDFDKNETQLGITVANYNSSGDVTLADIEYTVQLTAGSDLLTVKLDKQELKKDEEKNFTILTGEKQEKLHIISVDTKGNELTEEQKLTLKIHAKTNAIEADKAREETKYIDIIVKPKKLYWNAQVENSTVELNVDNVDAHLLIDNYQGENVTNHDIHYEISLENKESNPFAVTIDGTDLMNSSYVGVIARGEKRQENKAITIRKQDGKPITTNEQITLKLKSLEPLSEEKTFTIDVKQYYLIDYSGNGYHARLHNGAEIVKEADGYAIKLDGQDDFAQMPEIPNSYKWSDGIYIESNFKSEAFKPYAYIVSLSNTAPGDSDWKDQVFLKNYEDVNKLYFQARAKGNKLFINGTSQNTYALNQKTHITSDMYSYLGLYYSKMKLNGKESTLEGDRLSSVLYPINDTERKYNYIGKDAWGTYMFQGYIYDLTINAGGKAVAQYNLAR